MIASYYEEQSNPGIPLNANFHKTRDLYEKLPNFLDPTEKPHCEYQDLFFHFDTSIYADWIQLKEKVSHLKNIVDSQKPLSESRSFEDNIHTSVNKFNQKLKDCAKTYKITRFLREKIIFEENGLLQALIYTQSIDTLTQLIHILRYIKFTTSKDNIDNNRFLAFIEVVRFLLFQIKVYYPSLKDLIDEDSEITPQLKKRMSSNYLQMIQQECNTPIKPIYDRLVSEQKSERKSVSQQRRYINRLFSPRIQVEEEDQRNKINIFVLNLTCWGSIVSNTQLREIFFVNIPHFQYLNDYMSLLVFYNNEQSLNINYILQFQELCEIFRDEQTFFTISNVFHNIRKLKLVIQVDTYVPEMVANSFLLFQILILKRLDKLEEKQVLSENFLLFKLISLTIALLDRSKLEAKEFQTTSNIIQELFQQILKALPAMTQQIQSELVKFSYVHSNLNLLFQILQIQQINYKMTMTNQAIVDQFINSTKTIFLLQKQWQTFNELVCEQFYPLYKCKQGFLNLQYNQTETLIDNSLSLLKKNPTNAENLVQLIFTLINDVQEHKLYVKAKAQTHCGTLLYYFLENYAKLSKQFSDLFINYLFVSEWQIVETILSKDNIVQLGEIAADYPKTIQFLIFKTQPTIFKLNEEAQLKSLESIKEVVIKGILSLSEQKQSNDGDGEMRVLKLMIFLFETAQNYQDTLMQRFDATLQDLANIEEFKQLKEFSLFEFFSLSQEDSVPVMGNQAKDKNKGQPTFTLQAKLVKNESFLIKTFLELIFDERIKSIHANKTENIFRKLLDFLIETGFFYESDYLQIFTKYLDQKLKENQDENKNYFVLELIIKLHLNHLAQLLSITDSYTIKTFFKEKKQVLFNLFNNHRDILIQAKQQSDLGIIPLLVENNKLLIESLYIQQKIESKSQDSNINSQQKNQIQGGKSKAQLEEDDIQSIFDLLFYYKLGNRERILEIIDLIWELSSFVSSTGQTSFDQTRQIIEFIYKTVLKHYQLTTKLLDNNARSVAENLLQIDIIDVTSKILQENVVPLELFFVIIRSYQNCLKQIESDPEQNQSIIIQLINEVNAKFMPILQETFGIEPTDQDIFTIIEQIPEEKQLETSEAVQNSQEKEGDKEKNEKSKKKKKTGGSKQQNKEKSTEQAQQVSVKSKQSNFLPLNIRTEKCGQATQFQVIHEALNLMAEVSQNYFEMVKNGSSNDKVRTYFNVSDIFLQMILKLLSWEGQPGFQNPFLDEVLFKKFQTLIYRQHYLFPMDIYCSFIFSFNTIFEMIQILETVSDSPGDFAQQLTEQIMGLLQIQIQHVLGGLFIDHSKSKEFKDKYLYPLFKWILKFQTVHPIEIFYDTISIIENIFCSEASDEFKVANMELRMKFNLIQSRPQLLEKNFVIDQKQVFQFSDLNIIDDFANQFSLKAKSIFSLIDLQTDGTSTGRVPLQLDIQQIKEEDASSYPEIFEFIVKTIEQELFQRPYELNLTLIKKMSSSSSGSQTFYSLFSFDNYFDALSLLVIQYPVAAISLLNRKLEIPEQKVAKLLLDSQGQLKKFFPFLDFVIANISKTKGKCICIVHALLESKLMVYKNQEEHPVKIGRVIGDQLTQRSFILLSQIFKSQEQFEEVDIDLLNVAVNSVNIIELFLADQYNKISLSVVLRGFDVILDILVRAKDSRDIKICQALKFNQIFSWICETLNERSSNFTKLLYAEEAITKKMWEEKVQQFFGGPDKYAMVNLINQFKSNEEFSVPQFGTAEIGETKVQFSKQKEKQMRDAFVNAMNSLEFTNRIDIKQYNSGFIENQNTQINLFVSHCNQVSREINHLILFPISLIGQQNKFFGPKQIQLPFDPQNFISRNYEAQQKILKNQKEFYDEIFAEFQPTSVQVETQPNSLGESGVLTNNVSISKVISSSLIIPLMEDDRLIRILLIILAEKTNYFIINRLKLFMVNVYNAYQIFHFLESIIYVFYKFDERVNLIKDPVLIEFFHSAKSDVLSCIQTRQKYIQILTSLIQDQFLRGAHQQLFAEEDRPTDFLLSVFKDLTEVFTYRKNQEGQTVIEANYILKYEINIVEFECLDYFNKLQLKAIQESNNAKKLCLDTLLNLTEYLKIVFDLVQQTFSPLSELIVGLLVLLQNQMKALFIITVEDVIKNEQITNKNIIQRKISLIHLEFVQLVREQLLAPDQSLNSMMVSQATELQRLNGDNQTFSIGTLITLFTLAQKIHQIYSFTSMYKKYFFLSNKKEQKSKSVQQTNQQNKAQVNDMPHDEEEGSEEVKDDIEINFKNEDSHQEWPTFDNFRELYQCIDNNFLNTFVTKPNQKEYWDTFYYESQMNFTKDAQDIMNRIKLIEDKAKSLVVNLSVSSIRGIIDRQYIWESSIKQIFERWEPNHILWANLRINYQNEDGIDAGGLTQDFFSCCIREVLSEEKALFKLCPNGVTLHPNPENAKNFKKEKHYRYFGMLIAKGILMKMPMNFTISSVLLKRIYDEPLSVYDLNDIDPQLTQNLLWMMDNNVEDLGITFSYEKKDKLLGTTYLPLKKNGLEEEVTEDNQLEYIQLMSKHVMYNQVKNPIEQFAQGFNSIIPTLAVSLMKLENLKFYISGQNQIDVRDMRKHTIFAGFIDTDTDLNHIEWFWHILQQWDNKTRSQFVYFITGLYYPPITGFSELKIKVRKCYYLGMNKLPQSHTCFNTLDLPQFSKVQEMEQQFKIVMEFGGGFGMS